MKNNNPKLKILIISLTIFLGMFCLAKVSNAATITAASCSQADVQTAINTSVTGDTVSVPAGNCTWTTGVSIPNSKKIVLLGAGMDSTVITRAGTAIEMTTSGSRVTGFGFIGGAIEVDGDGWRIDHCKFYSASSLITALHPHGERVGLHPTGLVDNCSFHNGSVAVVLGAMLIERDDQHQVWAKPLNLGSTDNTVFVEDCVFTFTEFGNIIDENYGGGYVFRYNTADGAYIEAHSVQMINRAAKKWEIYGNIINDTTASGIYFPFRLRGGTGVVFYNSIIGNFDNDGIGLDNVRSYLDAEGGGLCDGDSLWDGNEDATGYPCRDQIGRGSDSPQWTHSPPGAYTQPLVPAYAWINRIETNSEVPFQVIAYSDNHIKANRDCYSYTASFNGSTGTGCGTLAARPATCTTGVGYWATNQSCSDLTGMVGASPTTPISGTLYKCTAPNTWTLYYTPYTYPHPLRAEVPPPADTTPPEAPSGVTVN